MKQVHVAGDRHDNAKAAKQIAEAIDNIPALARANFLDRNRPYKGQRWTDDGERGKQLIQGLTMRDVRDCLILAFYDSSPDKAAKLEDLPLERMSLEAISQNLGCWLERYMGIFPNVKWNDNARRKE